MNIMSLDLEFSQPDGVIIQVGVAIGDITLGTVLETRSWNIRSTTIVSPFITNLTGITQEDVDWSPHTLTSCYEELKELHRQYGCIRNPLTWGGGDTEALRAQLGMDNEVWLFGRRWIDAKTLFISRRLAQGKVAYGGLRRSLGALGMKFVGEPHRADADALNTFLIYHRLLDHFRVDPPSRP